VQTYPSWQAVTRHSSLKTSAVSLSCAIFLTTNGSISGTSVIRGHCALPKSIHSSACNDVIDELRSTFPLPELVRACPELPAPAELPLVGSEKFLRCSPLPLFRSPKLSDARRCVRDPPVDVDAGLAFDAALTELVDPPSIIPESLLVSEFEFERLLELT
jgi:hypothetical protein